MIDEKYTVSSKIMQISVGIRTNKYTLTLLQFSKPAN